MAGVLDSARYRRFLAWELGVSVQSVQAMVLGGHGDDMVPILSACTINGIRAGEVLSKEKIDAIVEQTNRGELKFSALVTAIVTSDPFRLRPGKDQ